MRRINNQQVGFLVLLRSAKLDWELQKDFADFIFPEAKDR